MYVCICEMITMVSHVTSITTQGGIYLCNTDVINWEEHALSSTAAFQVWMFLKEKHKTEIVSIESCFFF